MRGLLEGKRGKSTPEFVIGQSRFETALRLFGSKSERNGTKPVHSERVKHHEMQRNSLFLVCDNILIQDPAAMQLAIRAGRRYKVALCPPWTSASRLGCGPDLEK